MNAVADPGRDGKCSTVIAHRNEGIACYLLYWCHDVDCWCAGLGGLQYK